MPGGLGLSGRGRHRGQARRVISSHFKPAAAPAASSSSATSGHRPAFCPCARDDSRLGLGLGLELGFRF
eukprot:scaffold54669_cov58-Phaeocystis_antarctica.AAC.1